MIVSQYNNSMKNRETITIYKGMSIVKEVNMYYIWHRKGYLMRVVDVIEDAEEFVNHYLTVIK